LADNAEVLTININKRKYFFHIFNLLY